MTEVRQLCSFFKNLSFGSLGIYQKKKKPEQVYFWPRISAFTRNMFVVIT